MIFDIFSGIISVLMSIIKGVLSFFQSGFRFISDKTYYLSEILKSEKQRTNSIKMHFKTKNRRFNLNDEL